jgi:hypothetical protein
MTLIELVKTPRKRALLCLLYYGRIGYSFFDHNNNLGYHTLPESFAKIMSQDVFSELMEQLMLDRLIRQYEEPSEGGPLIMWRTTASGKRIVKHLLGEPRPDIVRTVGNVNEGIFLVEKFGLRKYESS